MARKADKTSTSPKSDKSPIPSTVFTPQDTLEYKRRAALRTNLRRSLAAMAQSVTTARKTVDPTLPFTPQEARRFLRLTREMARLAVEAHAQMITHLEEDIAANCPTENNSHRSRGDGFESVSHNYRDRRESEHGYLSIFAALQDLLRQEGELLPKIQAILDPPKAGAEATPSRLGAMALPDQEGFGFSSLNLLRDTMREIAEAQNPKKDPVDIALRRLGAAREAQASPEVISQLEAAVRSLMGIPDPEVKLSVTTLPPTATLPPA